jgi:hypothetical protein
VVVEVEEPAQDNEDASTHVFVGGESLLAEEGAYDCVDCGIVGTEAGSEACAEKIIDV